MLFQCKMDIVDSISYILVMYLKHNRFRDTTFNTFYILYSVIKFLFFIFTNFGLFIEIIEFEIYILCYISIIVLRYNLKM